MNLEALVEHYIAAWNQRDVARLLDLMHPGAAYYDAFWMETCVEGLEQYLQDAMDEEPFWYMQVGKIIYTDHGVAFRYSAHDHDGSGPGERILFGAEILTVVEGKILTVTDMYCSPYPSDLEELAGVAARRHGLASHVNYGLGAQKAAKIKAKLLHTVHEEKLQLDPDLSMAQLAETVGCTLEQLSVVIEKQFAVTAADFLDTRRVEHAKELLEENFDDPGIVERVASTVGFRSVRQFSARFADIVGVTPAVFCSKQKQKWKRMKPTTDNTNLH